MLGPVNGARVVELGAGIGRFTGELARTAGHVLAVDFMEGLIEQVGQAAHGPTQEAYHVLTARAISAGHTSLPVVMLPEVAAGRLHLMQAVSLGRPMRGSLSLMHSALFALGT